MFISVKPSNTTYLLKPDYKKSLYKFDRTTFFRWFIPVVCVQKYQVDIGR